VINKGSQLIDIEDNRNRLRQGPAGVQPFSRTE
jgi:hypothetical protein